ncbi:hypothetical protein BKA58DRAFT_41044 [Alternaria rosae]|uniref:uncharacterized protein n=1 Tax=Alternaria rosae TaxID=1187941 RepID=UPI001E8DE192|nr:uncharacterized protein BKA58DRAFT_41044 [Alternaria rosae]KAH6860866.1 hypothetical protein BKA58DRAFT_41044 [Alternaria rosae]
MGRENANPGCMCKPRRTPDAYTIAIVKLTSSSCRSVTYTHTHTQAMPSARDYGVSKHVAGAIVHEPVPYSSVRAPQAASEARECWQAAAYDERQTKPRLDPPVQFLSPSCYPLLYPAATPREPPLPMSLFRLLPRFSFHLPRHRAGAEFWNHDGGEMDAWVTRSSCIGQCEIIHAVRASRSRLLASSGYDYRSWPMRSLCGTVRSR